MNLLATRNASTLAGVLVLVFINNVPRTCALQAIGLDRSPRFPVATKGILPITGRPHVAVRPCESTFQSLSTRRCTSHQSGTSRSLTVSGLLPSDIASSLFRYSGQVPFAQAVGINLVLFTAFKGKLLGALTLAGYFHAMALGTLLWMTLGWRGWSFCVLYLILGQLVTKVRFADKVKRGIAESRGGRRGPENVWGSAATSLFCAVGYVYGNLLAPSCRISPNLFLLGYVAALSTKLADTFASEIGKAYGKTTFLITNLKRVEPGTEGAISAEGTVAAAFGGLLLSLYGYALGFIDLPSVAVSTFAAFVATNIESLIGATIQGKDGFGFMTNEVVNFLNTLIGGTIAMAIGKIMLLIP